MTAAGRRGEGSGAAGRARSGRSARSWPSGVDGDDLSAATADQHHPVQLLGEDLQEFHVCALVKETACAFPQPPSLS